MHASSEFGDLRNEQGQQLTDILHACIHFNRRYPLEKKSSNFSAIPQIVTTYEANFDSAINLRVC